MRIRSGVRQILLRAVTGSYVLNSGLGKVNAQDDQAKKLHTFAAGTYPFFEELEPQVFARVLGGFEIFVGGMLLTPLIRSRMAGALLATFASGLLGLYMNTPGMRREGSIRPTEEGMALAKDVWMLGIGAALMAEDGRGKPRRRQPKH
jgi:uncharacterized membrane protein YphA (DoxX/SURF4 family)